MAYSIGSYQGVTVYRSDKNASNCAPRVIVHFLAFLRDGETCSTFGGISETYAAMTKRARAAGFKTYTAREFGGGFIRSGYYGDAAEIAKDVINARAINI